MLRKLILLAFSTVLKTLEEQCQPIVLHPKCKMSNYPCHISASLNFLVFIFGQITLCGNPALLKYCKNHERYIGG